MLKDRVVILGAGLAGLSAAWHLKKRGVEPTVFEKEDAAGGLCRSKNLGGFIFDYCGHLLHFRERRSLQMVKVLLGSNLQRHTRNAWISNFGILMRYPFQANLHALPRAIALECLTGYLKAVSLPLRSGRQRDFLKWINASFGSGIARHFMVPYNEKFWASSLSGISCPWSDKFIPQPGPSDTIKGFFREEKKRFGYSATFWYPRRGGIGWLPRAFEKQIGRVHKNCCVTSIDLREKEIVIKGRGRERYDLLILTLPLPELTRMAAPLPAKILDCLGKLRWNSIFNLNIGVEGKCQADKHWIYFPQKEAIFFRTGFFHNFSGNNAPEGKSSLYAEVSYSKSRPLDRKGVVKRILRDLRSSGVLSPENKVCALDANDIKYGYPVYDRNYPAATAAIKEFLARNDIIACGRYGSWQYMSMEDAMLDGKRAALGIKS